MSNNAVTTTIVVFILSLIIIEGGTAVSYFVYRFRAWLRQQAAFAQAGATALGKAVGRLHAENTSSLTALGEAVGRLRIESSSTLSALGEAVGGTPKEHEHRPRRSAYL
jgi:hypothetical protein